MDDPSALLQLDDKANAAVASFVALLRGAAEGENAAKQEAQHWKALALEWQSKYEQTKKHADMLYKLSLERESSGKADRGHITTILEQDECRADSLDSTHTDACCSDRAQPVPDGGDEPGPSGSDPLTGSRGLTKVRVHRATADAAAQVAIVGNRQNSLPDLSSRRVPRHKSTPRKGSGSLSRKESGGPARVASQGSLAGSTPQKGPQRTTVGSLASWLMAYTMMQPGAIATRNGAPSKWDTTDPSEISAVSVLDDDGASGVGAAAAAAVSVALARSWAAAASQKQAAMVERTTSGSLKPGRAGFRLVAAVSNTDLARLNGNRDSTTPLGSSTSSNRGGTTPNFISPRSSSANLTTGATPFASLAECPFIETDGHAATQGSSFTKAHAQPAVAASQVGFGSLQEVSEQDTGASTSQQAQHAELAQQAQQASTSDDVNLKQTHPRQTEAAIRKQSYPLKPEIPVQQQSYPLQPDRAFPGSSEAGWQAFKPGMLGRDLKSAGSLPILQSALHRRSAFAAGAGVLPPGLGVVPTHDGPFPPQALILRDNSHRREAYANGQGTLPPAPPPPFGIRPVQTNNLSSAVSSDLDSPLDSTSASFVNLGEMSPKALPDERKMRHVESFNTDVVRQSIDKANRQEAPEKAITSAGSHLELHWLNPPRKILVVAKPSPDVLRSLVRVAGWLLEPARAMHVYVEPSVYARVALELQRSVADGKPGELTTWTPESETGTIPRYVADGLDAVVTLGGDGTVLWTCSILGNGSVPPLVPFAMGSLGFMTPFAMEKMTKTLDQIIRGGFSLMLRHRLHCKIERAETDMYLTDNNTHLDEQVVLNEVVIDRGVSPFLCNLECFCDGNFVTHVQGDGLIVSTPTGSTAYNLAAGGSMVHPQVPGVLFTPINPHSLSSRPLVLPESIQIRVKVPADSRSEMWCSFDGKDRQRLAPGDAVLIYMSQHPIPTVCKLDASHDWFLSMHNGLHWNIRKQQAGAGK